MKWFSWKTALMIVLGMVACGLLFLIFLLQKPVPERITYGVSFNTPYARELGLNWREAYDAVLDELEVRHLRLAAHWPMVEPRPSIYNFEELDYQVERAEEVGAEVVLAIGRRLPRWPECHIPEWVDKLSEEQVKQRQVEYVTAVVERYKHSPAIKIWQVENEPFLTVFAYEHCGRLDKDLLDEEIALVKKLDGTRPILLTDSGNLGSWIGSFSRGDMFGTSVYVHFWNPELGQFRTLLPPWFYRVEDNFNRLLYGDKPTV